MSRVEEFLDKLEDEICHRTDIDDFDNFMTELAKEMTDRYLRDAWIPCSERLPVCGIVVLFGYFEFLDQNIQCVGIRKQGDIWATTSRIMNPPTHWQPLPEPPKEKV